MNLFNQFFETNDVFIIAEIGKNFIQTEEEQSVETYLENAKALIDSAVDSGVDAVKFQTYITEKRAPKDNKEIFKFKPYVDEGWGLLNQYRKEFGEFAIDNNISYGSFLKRAKLIICTYPQTDIFFYSFKNKRWFLFIH